MKLFLFIWLLSNATLLNAQTYDDDILSIFSKILPRLVLMSNLSDKIKNSIDICILHDSIDERSAIALINKTKETYPYGLKTYKLKLHHQTYNHLASCKNTQLLFLFNTSEANIEKTLHFAKQHQVISVSYDNHLLTKGVSVSLFIGRKTTPYINVQSLRQSGIKFENILLFVSKIYSETDK